MYVGITELSVTQEPRPSHTSPCTPPVAAPHGKPRGALVALYELDAAHESFLEKHAHGLVCVTKHADDVPGSWYVVYEGQVPDAFLPPCAYGPIF